VHVAEEKEEKKKQHGWENRKGIYNQPVLAFESQHIWSATIGM